MSISLQLVEVLKGKFQTEIDSNFLLDDAEQLIRTFFEALQDGLKEVISVSDGVVYIDILSPDPSIIAEMKVFEDNLIFERNKNKSIIVWHYVKGNKKQISELTIENGGVVESGSFVFNKDSLEHFIKKVFGNFLEEK